MPHIWHFLKSTYVSQSPYLRAQDIKPLPPRAQDIQNPIHRTLDLTPIYIGASLAFDSCVLYNLFTYDSGEALHRVTDGRTDGRTLPSHKDAFRHSVPGVLKAFMESTVSSLMWSFVILFNSTLTLAKTYLNS